MTMTAVQEPPPQTTQRVILENVSWETYKQLLAEMGDRRTSRIAYNQGVLEIIMPSDRHETYKQLLERMVNTLTEELNLRVKGFASTTLNREDLRKGAEPDSCYYIQNVDRIRGRTVDLAINPPPDLVIEVDITSYSRRRFEIYKQLGVPEIWRYLGQTVRINQLQEGEYVELDYSPTFPFVSAATLNQFLQRAETTDDTTMIRAWRQWVGEPRES
ncbi:MAG: Uma2 family endonuclease [Hormoscilla sp. GM7CHS1pb]|nr:Uma2 family endonuclease [Hormoscilla sp. GM7CHS1pb]